MSTLWHHWRWTDSIISGLIGECNILSILIVEHFTRCNMFIVISVPYHTISFATQNISVITYSESGDRNRIAPSFPMWNRPVLNNLLFTNDAHAIISQSCGGRRRTTIRPATNDKMELTREPLGKGSPMLTMHSLFLLLMGLLYVNCQGSTHVKVCRPIFLIVSSSASHMQFPMCILYSRRIRVSWRLVFYSMKVLYFCPHWMVHLLQSIKNLERLYGISMTVYSIHFIHKINRFNNVYLCC